MSKRGVDSEEVRRCDYNGEIICKRHNCLKCGWHPKVEAERIERLMKGENPIQEKEAPHV